MLYCKNTILLIRTIKKNLRNKDLRKSEPTREFYEAYQRNNYDIAPLRTKVSTL